MESGDAGDKPADAPGTQPAPDSTTENPPAASTDSANPPAAGADANGNTANGANGTNTDPNAKPADNSAKPDVKESTSKKKKGLKKLVPW